MDLAKGVAIFAFAFFVLFSAGVVGDRLINWYIIDSVPSISAKCKDGTYSTSKKDSGTCSRHGGVKVWVVR